MEVVDTRPMWKRCVPYVISTLFLVYILVTGREWGIAFQIGIAVIMCLNWVVPITWLVDRRKQGS